MTYDYFYGGQSESFPFYRIPRQLITGAEFRNLSTDAKLLYGMMLDRMGLSARNGWYDELDRVYIYYTVEEITEDLCCGHNKAVRLLAELDTNGVGLIERKKQGQGKPTMIYVKQFVETVPTTPRGASYKNHNQTDLSYTDPSIHPSDDREIEESVREQIDYPLLAQSYPYDDPDCLLELICEVLTSTAPTIRIGSENIPTPKVQDRFRKLTFEHVAYVMDALRETTTKIWNIRAYLLTALYNAPITIGPYYAAAVRHDYG